MRKYLFLALLSAGMSSVAMAANTNAPSEEKMNVVFRVNTVDNSVAVASTPAEVTNEAQAINMMNNVEFTPVANENIATESDHITGTSNWYYVEPARLRVNFYYGHGHRYHRGYNRYYYPRYYRYGRYYSPYYCYYYGYYRYCGY